MSKTDEGPQRPQVDDATARQAADRAIDQDSLLDGEDPELHRLDEAEHWIAAYSELVNYKDALLATSDGQLRAMITSEALQESAGSTSSSSPGRWRSTGADSPTGCSAATS